MNEMDVENKLVNHELVCGFIEEGLLFKNICYLTFFSYLKIKFIKILLKKFTLL